MKDWQRKGAAQLDESAQDAVVEQLKTALRTARDERDAFAAESDQLQRNFAEIWQLLEKMRAVRDVECATVEQLRQIAAQALAQRDAEAAAVDRMRPLYEEVLRWAILVDIEARQAGGVDPLDHLSRGSFVHYALWRAVEQHRDAHPASAGPSAGPDLRAIVDDPSVPSGIATSLRPWAPVEPLPSILGSAAERLARLADLTADRLLPEGFLGRPVVRAEALAYQDAVRSGLTALRAGGRVRRRTHRILQDLAATRRAHDPALAAAADVLVDALRDRIVAEDDDEGEAATGPQEDGPMRHARPIREPDLRDLNLRARMLALADELEADGIEGHGGIAALLRRRVAGDQVP